MDGKPSKATRKPAGKKKPAGSGKTKPPEDDIVADVLEGIREEIGDDGAQVLGSDAYGLKIRGVISTQCPTVDAAIGRGGIPLSRLTILHGAEGSGKTTIALHIVAETQRLGGLVVYMDKEYKLDPDYAESIGVDTDRFIISYPKTLEQLCKAIKSVIKRAAAARRRSARSSVARSPILVVVDSMNACIAKAVLEGEEDAHHIAPEARIWSRNLPEIIELCFNEDVALLFISQVRKKIGVMFGNDEEIAGGNAPRFYASLIMHVKRIGTEKKDGTKTGSVVEVECRKNQIAKPFQKGKAVIKYGSGIDFEQSLLLLGEKTGVITKSGSWLDHDGERIGAGYVAAAKVLRKNREWRDKIWAAVKTELGWEVDATGEEA